MSCARGLERGAGSLGRGKLRRVFTVAGRPWRDSAGDSRTNERSPRPRFRWSRASFWLIRAYMASVPPAGFEPAPPPPEGGALSPELRGPCGLAKNNRSAVAPESGGEGLGS